MYVRGMGQACDAGYSPTTDASGNGICQQNVGVSVGDTCIGSSFPWVGSIVSGGACAPFSPLLGYAAVGILALVLLKGGRR